MWPAIAVNARGDEAVAWIQEGRAAGHATLRVRVAWRAAGAPRMRFLTLVAGRDRAARGTAVALDARGELTVAWVEQASDNGRTHGPKLVRAAYRLRDGHWSPPRTIGRSSSLNYAAPRLAVATGRSVVLTYNARVPGLRGVAAAWRASGRPFGAPRSVPLGREYLLEPTLAADLQGRVFLTGTRGCATSDGAVEVAIAPPGRARFTRRVTLTTTSGHAVRMSVRAPDAVTVGWLSGGCDTTEELGGRPSVTIVRGGVAAPPTALGTDQGRRRWSPPDGRSAS